MFSGGTYDEVSRWLRNFLTSHAKREDPACEVRLEAGDDREGRGYGARVPVGRRLGEPVTSSTIATWRTTAERWRGAWRWPRGSTSCAHSLLAAGSPRDARVR